MDKDKVLLPQKLKWHICQNAQRHFGRCAKIKELDLQRLRRCDECVTMKISLSKKRNEYGRRFLVDNRLYREGRIEVE